MTLIHHRFLRTKFSLLAAIVACWLLVAPMALASGRDNTDSTISDKTHTSPAQAASVDAIPRLMLESGDVMDPPALDNARSSGAGAIRLTVEWSNIEPSNTDVSQYNWTSTDSRLRAVASRGLAPIIVVLGCPTWACPHRNGPLYNNMGAEVTQFIGAMAARYKQAPYNAHYWELWNEPDDTYGSDRQTGWGMHPDKYAQMLASVYPAIKGADPGSVVMVGGLAFDLWFNQGGSFNPDFLPNLLTITGGRNADALAFHYYKNNNNGWTNIALKAAQITGVLRAHNVNWPLICTESGLTSSSNYGSSEPVQARYLVQMNAQSAASGVRATSWYLNRDFDAGQPGWEVFALSGLTRLDNSPKPAFTAFQVFAREIGSGDFVRQMGTADGMTGSLEGYRFRTADGTHHVSVVWNNDSGQQTLTIPATQAADLIGAVNLYGQAVTVQSTGDTKQVSVGSDPIYLRWNSGRFVDVPTNSWMYSYVEWLAARGVVSGYANSEFRPNEPATRGQFAKMIVIGVGWPMNTAGGQHFVDVSQSSVFYPFVETGYNGGILNGYSCGGEGEPCPGLYYRPSTNITRGQIAKLIVLSKRWSLVTPATPSFNDVPSSSVFFPFVETAVSHGVVSGYTDRTFRANENATRAQLSKMLALSLQQP